MFFIYFNGTSRKITKLFKIHFLERFGLYRENGMLFT